MEMVNTWLVASFDKTKKISRTAALNQSLSKASRCHEKDAKAFYRFVSGENF